MFEKEAKEYIDKHSEYDETLDMTLVTCSTEKVFRDAAEFGYKKANEWHFVKNGDLPEENKLCLIYLGNAFNLITGWYKDDYWYFEDCRNVNLWQDKVIAWKEVILPED